MGSMGLMNALKDTGCLDYVFNQTGDEPCDYERLRANPIFYVRGFLDGRMPFVARAGNQFKVAWNSESWFTRHGEEDTSTDHVKRNQEHFNMMFTCAESDLDMYSIPTYHLPSWADMNVLGHVKDYEVTDKLGFIGGISGREDFLSKDKNGIIVHDQTKKSADPFKQTQDYTELINKYKMLVSPPGRCFNGMCGRAFEIMGCKRMAFVYLNPDTMFRHMHFFKDGHDLVYFETFDDLEDKFNYYLKHPKLVDQIALNGYEKVKEFHNQDVRAKYIIDCIKWEYLKWKEDQENIPESIKNIETGFVSV